MAALGLAFWLGHRTGIAVRPSREPTFTRITFGQGIVWAARFAPDAKTVVYSAAWDGEPVRLYTTHTDHPESTPLSLPDAHLLSVSGAGELAVSLGHRFEGWMGEGTLARTPLLGGGARPVLEGVREADWTPDGSELAIVRRVGGLERLEFPPGKVLYETGGFVSHIRFSPKGDRIAFADHPLFADDIGSLSVVDLGGHRTVLTTENRAALRGLAWSPAGDEIWFTAAKSSEDMAVWAIDLHGRERLLLSGPTGLLLYDVSRDGRLLIGRETSLRHVEALAPGQHTAPRLLDPVELDEPWPLRRRERPPRHRSERRRLRGLPASPRRLASRPARRGRRLRPLSRRTLRPRPHAHAAAARFSSTPRGPAPHGSCRTPRGSSSTPRAGSPTAGS